MLTRYVRHVNDASDVTDVNQLVSGRSIGEVQAPATSPAERDQTGPGRQPLSFDRRPTHHRKSECCCSASCSTPYQHANDLTPITTPRGSASDGRRPSL